MLSETRAFLAETISSAWLQPYRGEIWGTGIHLGPGYAVRGQFNIESAAWLKEPLQAIRDPAVRLVSIQGAVQTCKSLLADLTVPFWILNDCGDCLWLLETDHKTK